ATTGRPVSRARESPLTRRFLSTQKSIGYPRHRGEGRSRRAAARGGGADESWHRRSLHQQPQQIRHERCARLSIRNFTSLGSQPSARTLLPRSSPWWRLGRDGSSAAIALSFWSSAAT